MIALYGLGLLTGIVALYLLTLRSALSRVAPQNRTMAPELVWLQLVPLFGLYWHFRNVLALGESLERESRSRGVPTHRPHQSLGIAAGICLIVGYGITWSSALTYSVPNGLPSFMWTLSRLRGLASIVALAGVLCIALYWMRVARSSREIAGIAAPRPQSSAGTGPTAVCPACGVPAPSGRFCTNCGAERAG
jgi:hypothetical protein